MVFAVSELHADAEKGRMQSLLTRLAAQDARFPQDKPDRIWYLWQYSSAAGILQASFEAHRLYFLGNSRRAE
jgi:hypothetical protein